MTVELDDILIPGMDCGYHNPIIHELQVEL